VNVARTTRHLPIRLAALAAVAALGACRQFGSADAEAWREALDAGTIAAEPPAPGTKLDLAAAMRLASARDDGLGLTGEAYVRALIERRRVASRFLPEITLSPRGTLREGSSSADSSRAALDIPLEAALDVSPVADAADLRAAGLSAEAARARLLAEQDELFFSVARAHFAVLRSERRAAVLRASLVVQQARVDDAKARVEAGLQRPLDVALAESRAADARVRLVVEETQARNARTALGFLTAWDVGDTRLDDRVEALPVVADDDASALRASETRRPELRALALDVDAAAESVEAAYGAYWPSISVDLAFLLSRDSEPQELDWTSALEISIPLFTGGRIEADIRTALSRLRESKLRLSRFRRVITRDLALTRENIASADRRIDALRVRLDAASRALDLAESQWRAGLATNLERLTAQDELLSVELELAQTVLDRALAAVERLRVTGRIRELAGFPPAAVAAEKEAHDAAAR
jgi:outer membrane protein TolC